LSSLDAYEFPGQAHFGSRAAVELPPVPALLLKSRVVDFLGVGVCNLPKPLPSLSNELGCKYLHAHVLGAGDHLRANAIALAFADLDRKVLPSPLPDHILQIGRGSGHGVDYEKDRHIVANSHTHGHQPLCYCRRETLSRRLVCGTMATIASGKQGAGYLFLCGPTPEAQRGARSSRGRRNSRVKGWRWASAACNYR